MLLTILIVNYYYLHSYSIFFCILNNFSKFPLHYALVVSDCKTYNCHLGKTIATALTMTILWAESKITYFVSIASVFQFLLKKKVHIRLCSITTANTFSCCKNKAHKLEWTFTAQFCCVFLITYFYPTYTSSFLPPSIPPHSFPSFFLSFFLHFFLPNFLSLSLKICTWIQKRYELRMNVFTVPVLGGHW